VTLCSRCGKAITGSYRYCYTCFKFPQSYIDRKGYPIDKKTGKPVHQLVAEKKFGNRPKGYDTHHINGDKTDNRPKNLRYLPHKEHFRLNKDGDSSKTSHQGSKRKRKGFFESLF